MPYLDVFDLFWKQVTKSVAEGRFAKLTMAKTIGKPDLRNIFVRPVYSEEDFYSLAQRVFVNKKFQDRHHNQVHLQFF